MEAMFGILLIFALIPASAYCIEIIDRLMEKKYAKRASMKQHMGDKS